MRDAIIVNRWGARFAGRRFACSIGRGGITSAKREGDGATPRGDHALVAVLLRRDRHRKPAISGAKAIGPADLWSDDCKDPQYNHAVRAPHRFGHERLFRADPLYDLVIVTDWNWPRARPGAGSAIFVHQWRRPRYPTAGCVAFSRRDLLWIAKRLTPRTRLMIR